MGMGYSYICKKCGHKYSVFPDVGMMYPHVYRQKLAEIAEGAYGTERKNLVEKTSYAAIDAEEIIYICRSCNRWETGTDITLYAPDDPESISKKQYGIKTVEEWGYVPYVTGWDLKEDYHVLKGIIINVKNVVVACTKLPKQRCRTFPVQNAVKPI